MSRWILAIATGIFSLGLEVFNIGEPAKLYAQIPACQPPQSGEYLLFIRPHSAEDQQKLVSILPTSIFVSECQYLEDRILKIGGFDSLTSVTNWGRYAIEIGGLEAIAIQSNPNQPNPIQPTNNLNSTLQTYNPQPLGQGYAVLVDYFNRPEFANQLQQALAKPVGLVSFGQRPFLLALQTTNQGEAKDLLKSLSDRGFSALMVDSRQVILLRSQLQL